jgi:hypothetical protein
VELDIVNLDFFDFIWTCSIKCHHQNLYQNIRLKSMRLNIITSQMMVLMIDSRNTKHCVREMGIVRNEMLKLEWRWSVEERILYFSLMWWFVEGPPDVFIWHHDLAPERPLARPKALGEPRGAPLPLHLGWAHGGHTMVQCRVDILYVHSFDTTTWEPLFPLYSTPPSLDTPAPPSFFPSFYLFRLFFFFLFLTRF